MPGIPAALLFALLLCQAAVSQEGPVTRERRTRPDGGQSGERVIRYEPTWESPEFGDISEIKDMTKVYVYSEDLDARRMIIDELKADPRLQVVGSADDAEFIINYTYSGVTTATTGYGITSVKDTVNKGELLVTIRGRFDDERRLVHQRIVWSTKKTRSSTLTKNPARKSAEAFIKDLKKERGEK